MQYHINSSDAKILRQVIADFRQTRTKTVPQRRRRGSPSDKGASTFDIRFAITILDIPAAIGTVDGPVSPGYATESDVATDSVQIFTYGSTIGAEATFEKLGQLENYSLSVIDIYSGLMVFERTSNIWVPVTQFCESFPLPTES
jgi:hypothetical protein